MLVELANETVNAAAKISPYCSFGTLIRNRSGRSDVSAGSQVSVLVHGFHAGSVKDKTQKQKHQHTCRSTV